jgi:hypothetical protein
MRTRGVSPVTGRKPADMATGELILCISAIAGDTLEKKKSGFLKIQVAVAVTLFGYFFLMIDAGTFNYPVLLLIPAPYAAGTIGMAELCLVAHQSPNHGHELLLIGVKCPAVFMRIAFCPFEHIIMLCTFVCHDI